MALTKSQSISLTGQCKIDETVVVSMTAKIAESGNSNIVATIVNQELYDANKDTCRADIDAFTAYVREVEDNQITE